jgi:hypothetical protein
MDVRIALELDAPHQPDHGIGHSLIGKMSDSPQPLRGGLAHQIRNSRRDGIQGNFVSRSLRERVL